MLASRRQRRVCSDNPSAPILLSGVMILIAFSPSSKRKGARFCSIHAGTDRLLGIDGHRRHPSGIMGRRVSGWLHQNQPPRAEIAVERPARILTITMNPAIDISTSVERVVPERKL